MRNLLIDRTVYLSEHRISTGLVATGRTGSE